MELNLRNVERYVTDLLKKNKALTEREVKAAIGKVFKTNPKKVGAAVIREVRKRLGIDRPSALAYARALLRKDPVLEARKVMDTIAAKFGVRLGPPDVSRLRPKSAKRARRGGRPAGRPARAAAPAGRPGRPGRKPGRPGRKPGRPGRKPGISVKFGKGHISINYQGIGSPADLAAFFRSLAG
jgi:hypothetical protein